MYFFRVNEWLCVEHCVDVSDWDEESLHVQNKKKESEKQNKNSIFYINSHSPIVKYQVLPS